MRDIIRKCLISYKTLVVLSALIALLAVNLTVLTRISDNMSRTSADVEKRVEDLRISETEQRLYDLDKLLAQYEFPVMNRADARDYMLDALEEFRRLYGARVKVPITESESALSMTINFAYTPADPDDLTKLLSYLRKSTAPVFNVKLLSFRYTNGIRTVNIEADMIQPFSGGRYVY